MKYKEKISPFNPNEIFHGKLVTVSPISPKTESRLKNFLFNIESQEFEDQRIGLNGLVKTLSMVGTNEISRYFTNKNYQNIINFIQSPIEEIRAKAICCLGFMSTMRNFPIEVLTNQDIILYIIEQLKSPDEIIVRHSLEILLRITSFDVSHCQLVYELQLLPILQHISNNTPYILSILYNFITKLQIFDETILNFVLSIFYNSENPININDSLRILTFFSYQNINFNFTSLFPRICQLLESDDYGIIYSSIQFLDSLEISSLNIISIVLDIAITHGMRGDCSKIAFSYVVHMKSYWIDFPEFVLLRILPRINNTAFEIKDKILDLILLIVDSNIYLDTKILEVVLPLLDAEVYNDKVLTILGKFWHHYEAINEIDQIKAILDEYADVFDEIENDQIQKYINFTDQFPL